MAKSIYFILFYFNLFSGLKLKAALKGAKGDLTVTSKWKRAVAVPNCMLKVQKGK